MKLIVHMGLHKTGSTWLQQLLLDNRVALAGAGFWYADTTNGYPAHHRAADMMLNADASMLAEMVRDARRAGCHTVILSSENLEAAIHDPRPSAAIAATARDCGVGEVEWHVVLRHPGALFPSLFAQLQHHLYADSFQMFYDIMRRGCLYYLDPDPDGNLPYWYYSFDHARDLDRFEQRLCHLGAHDLIAHDYEDKDPFPGWAMLPPEARAALTITPDACARNSRMTQEAVAQGYIARVLQAVPDAGQQAVMLDAFTDSLRLSLTGVDTWAPLIGERFDASHREALDRFVRR